MNIWRAFILGGFNIFSKKFTHDFDTFNVTILLPTIQFGNDIDDRFICLDEDYKGARIMLPSKICFTKDFCHYSFSLQVLGFGVSLCRQWTY